MVGGNEKERGPLKKKRKCCLRVGDTDTNAIKSNYMDLCLK